jgi:hypothetical protein
VVDIPEFEVKEQVDNRRWKQAGNRREEARNRRKQVDRQ